MAETKLKDANENPWYVLATIYGEQKGEDVDRELHDKNRRAWNAWACQNLSGEETASLAEDTGLAVEELRGWQPLQSEVETHFAKRLGEDVMIPPPEDRADFSEITISNTVAMENIIFTQLARFDSATFTQAARFDSATFTQAAVFNSATFAQLAWFNSATFTQAARFDSAIFSGFAYFLQTQFKGESEFADCQFEKPTNFRMAQFDGFFPVLDGAVVHLNTTFTARDTAEFSIKGDDPESDAKEVRRLWPDKIERLQKDLEAAKDSCSIIRHAVSQKGRPEDEHFFFRKEMGYAAQIGGWWQQRPYRLFGAVSNYGHSIAFPLIWLAVIVVCGTFIFAEYFRSSDFAATGRAVDNPWLTGLGFSTSNVLPGFGFGQVYFESGFQAALDWPIKVVAGTQSVLGVVLLFFLGLGLRTRFRLR
ncbi:MAG: pentapeptide repeat-containing protein [Paracoccaceae bacterium]